MNAKKQRDKNRRRAGKLAQQAWDAADDNNFDMAVKIIRRAVDLNPANPVLWNDQGMLFLQVNEDDKAAQSFQAAIYLAPEFAEAYASLAAIRARQGELEQALTLQREAVRHAPASERNRNTLVAYEALFVSGFGSGAHPAPEMQLHSGERRTERTSCDGLQELASRIESLNWPELDDNLTRQGFARIPGLLSAEQCESLRQMFDEGQRFSKTVTMTELLPAGSR